MKIFCVLLLLFLLKISAESQSIITTLPGFAGDLPFKLETGYVGVGEKDEVQLFYYFIESERSPKDDPLVLWLTGGPGCSAFSGLVYEIGPLKFDYANSSEKKIPTFELNPYSWTKVANIIFLDQPVGTGFSYSKTWEGYNVSDTLSAAETYSFLRKWLIDHPEFLKNPLYIAGDSYSGILVPIIVQEISNGNEVGYKPPMNLRGYVLGNPATQPNDENSRVPFAYLKSLISRPLYESIKSNCKGNYLYPDPSNLECINGLRAYTKCVEQIQAAQILEPICPTMSVRGILDNRRILMNSRDFEPSALQLPGRPWCRNDNYLFSYIWANDPTVREALHIREGTIKEWVRCNQSLSYTKNVTSTLDYHRNLSKKAYHVLIYSGDHDVVIPYLGTQQWIESLNLTIDDEWRPWFVDGQVAGYTVLYSLNNAYYLTFATVKGGGHTAPEYKPKECLAMLKRWFAFYPL